MAMVSGASTVAAPLGLSSSATLGASQMAQLAPVGVGKSAGGRIVAVKASGEEESRSLTKQVVGAVVAAGVALRLAGAGMGASGPGGDGGERTAGKAGELLSQADASMKNGSPQRFGPEREFGNGTDKALLPEVSILFHLFAQCRV